MMIKAAIICMFLLHAVHCCTPPFESIDDGCYLYSGNVDLFVDSYDAATSMCQSYESTLAMVKTGDLNRALLQYLRDSSIADNKVLLGATKNPAGQFEWIDGTLVRDGFVSWADGEPSDVGDCMGYSDDHELMWDDFQCDNYIFSGLLVGVLCEAPVTSTTQGSETTTPTINSTTTTTTTTATTITTTTTTTVASTITAVECQLPFVDLVIGCYYVLDQTDDFWTASDNCFSMEAHLAYINSVEKQLAIEEYLNSISFESDPWIGAHDVHGNDSFYWLDGVALEGGYTNYGQLSGEDDDALIVNRENWEWNDAAIDTKRASLCEKYNY